MYMGRERFDELWKIVRTMDTDTGYPQLYIHGTIGYGKSHILAALVCLLRRLGKRAVYIPDCRQILASPIAYIKSALICAFSDPDSKPQRNDIRKLSTQEDVVSFCVMMHRRSLYFIVDQMNALETARENSDRSPNSLKAGIVEFLDRLFVGQISITSFSANYFTALHMLMKQTGEQKLAMMGGLTEVRVLLTPSFACPHRFLCSVKGKTGGITIKGRYHFSTMELI